MDSLRLKFEYKRPLNNYFKSIIKTEDLKLKYSSGSKQVWTNTEWRDQQINEGIYMPKFWIESDYINHNKTYFVIELSVPKFLNGQSLSNSQDDKLDELVDKIINFCKQLDIFLTRDQVLNSVPIVFAVAANINLGKEFNCDSAIEALSKFDHKPHSKHRIVQLLDLEEAGKEIKFSTNTTEDFKIYSKNSEILYNPKTTQEKRIADLLKKRDRKVIEVLRIELTLKTTRKIKQKLKPYLGDALPILQNIYKSKLWKRLIKNEMNNIYNHPLKNFVFLALEQEPFISKFLDQNYSHIATKDAIRGMISKIQKKGIALTRYDCLNHQYRSRQTWYSYLKRLASLAKQVDLKAISNLTSYKIHYKILRATGIKHNKLERRGLAQNMSKK